MVSKGSSEEYGASEGKRRHDLGWSLREQEEEERLPCYLSLVSGLRQVLRLQGLCHWFSGDFPGLTAWVSAYVFDIENCTNAFIMKMTAETWHTRTWREVPGWVQPLSICLAYQVSGREVFVGLSWALGLGTGTVSAQSPEMQPMCGHLPNAVQNCDWLAQISTDLTQFLSLW